MSLTVMSVAMGILGFSMLACIGMAWTSMWGRLRLRAYRSDDPWYLKTVVASVLSATEIELDGQSGHESTSSKRRVAAMDPEEAVRFVIQTRRTTAVLFVGLAALLAICLTILVSGVLTRALSSGPIDVRIGSQTPTEGRGLGPTTANAPMGTTARQGQDNVSGSTKK